MMIKNIKLIQGIITISLVMSTVMSNLCFKDCLDLLGPSTPEALVKQDICIENEDSVHVMVDRKRPLTLTKYLSDDDTLEVKSMDEDKTQMMKLKLVSIPEVENINGESDELEIREFLLTAQGVATTEHLRDYIHPGRKLQLQFFGFP